MTTSQPTYARPVADLLELGCPPRSSGPAEYWHDYLAHGLTEAHVPELVRLASTRVQLEGEPDDEAIWGPIHAWRALGRLRAEAAIEPLLTMANELDRLGDDWFLSDAPRVFAMLGPPALEPLAEFLLNAENETYARVMAAESLRELARECPACRTPAIEGLCRALDQHARNDVTLNAFIIMYLVDLGAREAAEAIERAYAVGRVDVGVTGTWKSVRDELGVPGMGLVTAKSPRNPNSNPWVRKPLSASFRPESFQAVRDAQRKERRKQRRRRRR